MIMLNLTRTISRLMLQVAEEIMRGIGMNIYPLDLELL